METFQGDPRFVVLAVNVGEVEGMVTRQMQRRGWTFRSLLDTRSAVAQDYGISGHPESFLIDKRGRLVGVAVGPREWTSPGIDRFIRQLLGET